MSNVRFRVDPRDVPPEKAARRLGLTLERFNELLPRLLSRGFPVADQDTGYYDLDAIEQWRAARSGRQSQRPIVEVIEEAAKFTPRSSDGFVYLIHCGDYYKIGFAVDVDARIATLQIGSPYPLELIASFRGCLADERRLHRRYRQHHLHGEWFALPSTAVEEIKAMEADR